MASRRKWQAELDALMAPVLAEVFARAELRPGELVLDIGCGTGTSTLQAADRVGADGHVLGVDISEPMLARAREASVARRNVAFVTADAADFPFDRTSLDAVISRFGVMFFADPVKAFRNIRSGLRAGARLVMATWSHLDVNPWFRVPMYAAKAQLGAPPPVDPDAPGPLAFRDIDRVCGILADAGFAAPTGVEVSLQLTPAGEVTQAARHASSVGPASRTMDHFEGTEADFEAIVAQVADAFAPFVTPQGVLVPAAINYFEAVNPARNSA